MAAIRTCDGLIGTGPKGHLFSERGDYENFDYRVEAMINDHGNSGQYFRTEFGKSFPKGYEAQINSTHGDPVRTGSLYNFVKILKQLHKPNEWFTQEVEAVGNHIIIKVNGEKTVDFVDPKSNYMKGHFALQQHDPGTVVKFRKIEVKELPKDALDARARNQDGQVVGRLPNRRTRGRTSRVRFAITIVEILADVVIRAMMFRLSLLLEHVNQPVQSALSAGRRRSRRNSR